MSTRLYETADGKYVDAEAYDRGKRAGLAIAAAIANEHADPNTPDFHSGAEERAGTAASRIRERILAELAEAEATR